MMNYTPEGISPRFSSIICPDIPESFNLDWQFRQASLGDYQKAALIEIFYDGEITPIKQIALTGTNTSFNLSNLDFVWEKNRAYQWCVTTTNRYDVQYKSVKGKFYYTEMPAPTDVIWESGPVAYERLGAREYFNIISRNALIVMSDYQVDSLDEQNLYNEIVEKLFLDEIVPSRADFLLLERVIKFLYKKEVFTNIPEVDEIVEDGLGAGDIHKIYELFNKLMQKPPQPPTDIVFAIRTTQTPKITDINFASAGKEDTTVDISWNSDSIVDLGGDITMSGLSTSEDIRYYYCEYSYGHKDRPMVSKMYYRPEDLSNINNKITFSLRYSDFVTGTEITKVHHGLHVQAIDVRNNKSMVYGKTWSAPSDYKSAIGLDHYEVSFERAALTATQPNPNATYYSLYTSTGKSVTHTLAEGQEGVYFYRARYVDKTGIMSGWSYTIGNKFDPLKPPKSPSVWMISNGYTNINLGWNSVPTAEYYEIHRYRWTGWWGNAGTTVDGVNLGTTTALNYDNTGLTEKTIYAYYVRACNRAGASEWTGVSLDTKERPPVTSEQKAAYAECWRTPFYVNGRYYSGGWRTASWDVARYELIQGMWIELRDGVNTDGEWVPKGTAYGNHKSLIFLDSNYWRQTLAGKEILSCKLFLQRKSSRHGYPNDGRYIKVWTHGYDSPPSGEPWLGNGTEIWNVNFGRGDGKYVDLPISFGEGLRDGWAKGFALHTDFRTSDTDRYTYCRFDESAMYVKITYK